MTTHRYSTTDVPEQSETTGTPTFHALRYGRAVTVLGEDGDLGVLAIGHDRRALAAISAHGREVCGPRWAAGYPTPSGAGRWVRPGPVALTRWVLFHETCGCTPDQHAEHDRRSDTDPDWSLCPCLHWGLPPCEPDRFAWLATWVPAGTRGAVACTEVAW